MDAGAWHIGEGDERQLVFRFYGNEAIMSPADWEELCKIIDDIRSGTKEASLSLELANMNGKPRRRIPVGEKVTLEMLGLAVTPKKPQFTTPMRRL